VVAVLAGALDRIRPTCDVWLAATGAEQRGYTHAAARRLRVPLGWVRDDSTGNSDHREFELLGLPGMKVGSGAGGEPCRELACDRPERLDPVSLRLARRLAQAAIQSTAR
jgi:hypothetical protein